MLRATFVLFAVTAALSAGTRVFQAFEGDGFDDWKVEGEAFGLAPVAERTEQMKSPFTGYGNDRLAASTNGGEAATGKLTSSEFTIAEPYITFLISGGDQKGKTAAQLLIDGKIVREATGGRSLRSQTALWDVAEFKGRKAQIQLIDDATGDWGFIAVDHIIFSDYPNQKFPNTTRAGEAFVQGLVTTTAIAGVSIPIDSTLAVEATYEDQKLTSPTALTFDEQGRIYISETHRFRTGGIEDNREHLYWYLDDLASKKVSDRRALHEKWKEKLPLEKMTSTSEVIRRLADTNGDGTLDESTVFAEDFKDLLDGTAAGVLAYEGSLYFACIPKIWMLRDSDGDGKADERKVVEEGFGVRISLSGHDLNGFTLGPDGRIYGTVGDRGLSLVTKAGVAYDYPNEGAAFRFEPDGTGFEIFHTGLRNPKEIAFDALGNAFSVDNNSDQGDKARVVYLVEGGDTGWQMEHQGMHSFHRQIGLEQRPPSRWMDEKMWELENSTQPAYMLPPSAYLTSGPSGLTYHPGAGFLESEAGRFLICDYRGGSANSGIWSFEMKPKAAGMEMTDSRQFAWGIGATDVEYSWDGRVFVTDFMNGWKSHSGGRLLSLSAGEKIWQADAAASTPKIMREGFDHRSSAELANLLKHPDGRVRLRAQIALTRKPDALTRFTSATVSSNYMVRIHGIWGLGILARRGPVPLPYAEFGDVPNAQVRIGAEIALVALLKDKDPEIRSQTLRSLIDSPNTNITIPLGPLLNDESPRVRFFAALVAGKRKLIGYYGPICDMLQENDNRDVFLRHAGIYALQHLSPKPAAVSALVSHDSAAVRLAATVALRRMKNPDIALFVSDSDPKVADEAIRAIVDMDMVNQRPEVAALLDDLATRSWTPFMLRRLLHNSFRIGDAENAARVLKFAANPNNPEKERKEALRLISIWTQPPPADQLTGHFRPLEKRDPEILQPVLTAALAELLKQDGFVLTSALSLIAQYHVNVAGLDENMLRGLSENAELPASARANAIRLLVENKPKNLVALLDTLSADPAEEVALTALSSLVAISPDTAITPLETAVRSDQITLIQKTWKILATLPGSRVDGIFIKSLQTLRNNNGVSGHAIELIEAARERNSAPVTEALAKLEKSLAENSDPLTKWNITLEGGDPEAGFAIFTSHPASECMRCHRAEEGHAPGGETAPNLIGIASRFKDRRYFLESMVLPSAVITPGFGAVLIDFKNGASLSGNVLAEATDHLDLDAAGEILRIQRGDIASVTPPVSPMPAMGDLLNPREMRDVITWLASLDTGGEEPKPIANPQPLDPNTLKIPEKSEAAATVDPDFLKTGQQQFLVCGACHGQAGEGTAAGPPLAGSEWVNGPVENLIHIQLRGLQGPITVKGVEYNFPAGMAAMAYQTDDQIAAVLTYIRTAFGNSASAVAPAEVAALRGEVGKPPVTTADLTPPIVASPKQPTAPPETAVTETKPQSDKYAELPRETSFSKWTVIAIGLLIALALVLIFKRKSA
jgi:quinoprotein glucose dehydrogenase